MTARRTAFRGAPDHDHASPGRTGVLVTNLGTPDAPTPAAVRRYLAEFLGDPRVIELPRWLWRLILHGVILRIRPRRSAALYRKIWTDVGSPLLVNARRQRDALAAALDGDGAPAVAVAMRYGNPGIDAALETLRAEDVRRLIVLPLYPQYSATTTGSTFDAVAAALARWRFVPELHFVTHYHDHPGYVDALAGSVRAHRLAAGPAERLLFSFHGIPRRYFEAGDPYHCHCRKTARLVSERLGLAPGAWSVSFQSRVGRERWLEPYTDETLAAWGREGLGRVQVIAPGFSADCLETLEELAITGREQFTAAGGGALEYIPALNDAPAHIAALADLVRTRLAGFDPARDAPGEAGARRARALALGAAR